MRIAGYYLSNEDLSLLTVGAFVAVTFLLCIFAADEEAKAEIRERLQMLLTIALWGFIAAGVVAAIAALVVSGAIPYLFNVLLGGVLAHGIMKIARI